MRRHYIQRDWAREQFLIDHEEETVPLIMDELEADGETATRERAVEVYCKRLMQGDYYGDFQSLP